MLIFIIIKLILSIEFHSCNFISKLYYKNHKKSINQLNLNRILSNLYRKKNSITFKLFAPLSKIVAQDESIDKSLTEQKKNYYNFVNSKNMKYLDCIFRNNFTLFFSKFR